MSGTPAVFLVTFMPKTGPNGLRILGIYVSEPDARAAIERAKIHPAVGDNDTLF